MRVASVLVLLLSIAPLARAQTPAQVVLDALEGNAHGSSGVGALGGGVIGGDSAVVMAVLRQQVTTLPVGTSSGGFTFEFDRALGIVVRKSDSFGGIFGDRPLTIGRGRVSLGVTTQHTTWRSLAGRSLADGELASTDLMLDDFYTDEALPVLERFGSVLDLRTDRTTVNLTMGLTDRIDINVIVPFGRTTVTGGVDYSYTVLPLNWVVRRLQATSTATGAGLGDITLRSKYAVWSRRGAAVALAGDVRVPTGNEEQLLGTGRLQAKATVLASAAVGPFSPRIEVGYLYGGARQGGLRFREPVTSFPELISAAPSDEITYTVGVDTTVTRRLTVAADILTRTLRQSAAIREGQVQRPQGSFTRELTYFYADPGSVTLVLGTVGAKLSVGSVWLITGSVLLPLNDAGLKAGISPVVGFERSF